MFFKFSSRILITGGTGSLGKAFIAETLHRFPEIKRLVVMLASGGAELVSLGAVLPFLAVLNNPERLWQQPLVQALAGRVGFTQASELLLPATLVFAVAAVLAAVGSDLSCEAYRRTLYQPYGVHVQRNSSAVLPFLAVLSAITPTEQEADWRGFPPPEPSSPPA